MDMSLTNWIQNSATLQYSSQPHPVTNNTGVPAYSTSYSFYPITIGQQRSSGGLTNFQNQPTLHRNIPQPPANQNWNPGVSPAIGNTGISPRAMITESSNIKASSTSSGSGGIHYFDTTSMTPPPSSQGNPSNTKGNVPHPIGAVSIRKFALPSDKVPCSSTATCTSAAIQPSKLPPVTGKYPLTKSLLIGPVDISNISATVSKIQAQPVKCTTWSPAVIPVHKPVQGVIPSPQSSVYRDSSSLNYRPQQHSYNHPLIKLSNTANNHLAQMRPIPIPPSFLSNQYIAQGFTRQAIATVVTPNMPKVASVRSIPQTSVPLTPITIVKERRSPPITQPDNLCSTHEGSPPLAPFVPNPSSLITPSTEPSLLQKTYTNPVSSPAVQSVTQTTQESSSLSNESHVRQVCVTSTLLSRDAAPDKTHNRERSARMSFTPFKRLDHGNPYRRKKARKRISPNIGRKQKAFRIDAILANENILLSTGEVYQQVDDLSVFQESELLNSKQATGASWEDSATAPARYSKTLQLNRSPRLAFSQHKSAAPPPHLDGTPYSQLYDTLCENESGLFRFKEVDNLYFQFSFFHLY